MTCVTDHHGNPVPSYTWSIDNRSSTSNTQQLTITSIHQEGTHSCTASNRPTVGGTLTSNTVHRQLYVKGEWGIKSHLTVHIHVHACIDTLV